MFVRVVLVWRIALHWQCLWQQSRPHRWCLPMPPLGENSQALLNLQGTQSPLENHCLVPRHSHFLSGLYSSFLAGLPGSTTLLHSPQTPFFKLQAKQSFRLGSCQPCLRQASVAYVISYNKFKIAPSSGFILYPPLCGGTGCLLSSSNTLLSSQPLNTSQVSSKNFPSPIGRGSHLRCAV